MQALRSWVPANALAVLTAGLFFCCGTDEAIKPHPTTPIEGNAGEGAGATGTGAGNSGGAPTAGSPAEAGSGPDLAGAASGGSAHAGAAPTIAGAGAGGEHNAGGLEQLSFCPRIPQEFENAGDVARVYNQAVYDDCRTRWLTDLFLEQNAQAAFLNDLVDWNMSFWGCLFREPVQSFALIYGKAPLSTGDAALLIEHYIVAATAELNLSQVEINEMQDALERLSEPLIADPSEQPSQPRCDTGEGGAAGSEGVVDLGGGGGMGGTLQ